MSPPLSSPSKPSIQTSLKEIKCVWLELADSAFENLNKAMLSNFTLETNVLEIGIGAVLSQRMTLYCLIFKASIPYTR